MNDENALLGAIARARRRLIEAENNLEVARGERKAALLALDEALKRTDHYAQMPLVETHRLERDDNGAMLNDPRWVRDAVPETA